MRKLLILGVLLVVGVELLALLLHQRQLLLWVSGGALAFLLLGIRRLVGGDDVDVESDLENTHATGDALHLWMSGTETRIRWSESTRTDWDRHWRPILARRFEMITGHRHAKDSAASAATGRMLFGAELWEWVDPANVARTGGYEPGPGRATLEEILQRLEQR